MTEPDPVQLIRAAVVALARSGADVGDAVSTALAEAAEDLGSVHALVAGRPGSWESAALRNLAGSASVPDSYLGEWRPT